MQVLIEDSDSEWASSESVCLVDTSSSEKTHRYTDGVNYISFSSYLHVHMLQLFSIACVLCIYCDYFIV